MSKLIDISDQIHRFVADSNVSLPQITYYLTYNIGELNILLNENTVYDTNLQEFSPELTPQQAEIFQYLYLVKYYTSAINSNLGAAAYDWTELDEGDSHIRKVSRNEVAKVYATLRNNINADLKMLVFYYKSNMSPPSTVARSFRGFGWDGSGGIGLLDLSYPFNYSS